ncbi:hypothetical protein FSP39_016521 [Pinctada imbricata]|uniref:Uncharacterized protein n=1 Tax=Pinctada imbricata TaxID=66713 RepID=A0AA88Y4W3_PINIB|nr:hypothetical protein FSP39_016521 [Pinctada imbricata]
MAECAHCSSQFQKRSGGYKRYSIENDLSCGKNAREIYEEENGVPFPVTESKRKGYFLCDNCWTVLNRVAKYRESVKEFWSLSSSNSSTGVKRSLSDDETSEEKYTEKGVVHVAKKHRSSAPMLIPKAIPKSGWS